VNASSLELAKQCPRKYELKIVEGYARREERVDTIFGTLVHEGLERYDRARLAALGHDEAVEVMVAWALSRTWDSTLSRPMVFDHPQKNRLGLIRTLVWYADRFPKERDLPLLMLPSGLPALELAFEFDSGFEHALTGEPITFIGRLDKMVLFNDKILIKDRKTTRHSLGEHYFSNFSPNGQVSQYTLAGLVAFGQPCAGLIIEGIQVGVDFTRFARAKIERTRPALDDWLRDAGYWLDRMNEWAEAQYWPQNDAACGLYGGCEFRAICSMDSRARKTWLEKDWARPAGRASGDETAGRGPSEARRNDNGFHATLLQQREIR
jgi:hypothetical protein